jgi:preprotein translocase subunit SecE
MARGPMAKAVVEAGKMEKVEGSGPTWLAKSGLADVAGWGPRKFRELKNFFAEVKAELKKVTWPSKKEVYATTMVVIMTTVFFGFYLYGLDVLLSQLFTRIVAGLQ